ncbi:MAG: glycoside hydrolase family 3 N-terminal domain-containing protein [Gemmatimonadales bacterium]
MTAGRLVLPALRWRDDTGFRHEEPAIEAALGFGAGGFILFGGELGAVRRLTADLRAAAGRPLLIASDLERGAGQQIRGLAELPPPLALASLDDRALVRGAGALTATEALSAGVDWVFAPVADLDIEPENPIVQTRAFGEDPEAVGALVAAWVAGCEAAGALACAKHWPGHGRTRTDSHDALPVVDAPAELLYATDMVPFASAVAAGVSSIMTAHVAYSSLDPSGAPATFSKPILDILREEIGFSGLIVSDALMMEGARAGRTEADGAIDALLAGVDLLLYPREPAVVAAELERRAGSDALVRARVDDALGRLDAIARRPPARVPAEIESGSTAAAADWLLSAPLLRGTPPAIETPVELVVVDDDLGGRWPAVPLDHVEATLHDQGVAIASGGTRVVLAAASPRASKGRPGFGPESLAALARHAADAALVVLFGHPRLAAEIPGSAPLLLAWHRQRLMQAAAARWIAAHRA